MKCTSASPATGSPRWPSSRGRARFFGPASNPGWRDCRLFL